jgi:hypothetical protein
MTGNIVVLGLALAGAAGLSISRTSVAPIAFLAGAVGAGRRQPLLAAALGRHCGHARRSYRRNSNGDSPYFALATLLQRDHGRMRSRAYAYQFKTETTMKIVIGFVLSFLIGAGCRYFHIPGGEPAGNSRRAYRACDDAGLHFHGQCLDPKRPSSHDQTLVWWSDWPPEGYGRLDVAGGSLNPREVLSGHGEEYP